jgi:hypothetical protein
VILRKRSATIVLFPSGETSPAKNGNASHSLRDLRALRHLWAPTTETASKDGGLLMAAAEATALSTEASAPTDTSFTPELSSKCPVSRQLCSTVDGGSWSYLADPRARDALLPAAENRSAKPRADRFYSRANPANPPRHAE